MRFPTGSPCWIRPAASLAAVLTLLAGRADAGIVQVPIGVDGQMGDWAPVLVSIQNYVGDLSAEQGDPDAPGTNDRDMRAFAVTWDATNVYFYFRRTFSANNSVTFLVYVDRDHDNDLDGNDRLIRFDFNGSSPTNRELHAYVPAGSADAITGDGVNEPGDDGTLLTSAMNSAATANGLEVEGSIAWASLGVSPGTPMRFHPSVATGMNLPGQVNDNGNAIDGQYAAVTLVQARLAAGASPSVASFAHTLTNTGNGSDRIELSATSVRGWSLSFYSDPNGDGDPADGVLLATDGNGDGDFGDVADVAPGPGADGDDDGLPDSGSILSGAAYRFVVQVQVPAGLANGTEDMVAVLARSSVDLGAVAENDDRVVAGETTIAPDREQIAPAGSTANAAHRACNFRGGSDVIDLASAASLGWTVSLWSDPNGDGDPADGALLIDTDGDGKVDTGSLASGACLDLVSRVTVPPGTSSGTRNLTTLTATSSAGSGSDLALDGLTAAAQVTLDPDRSLDALPGDVVYAPRTATNGWPAADSFNLTGSGSLGSTIAFRTDPNCDGFGDDGVSTSVIGPLRGAGGSSCLLSEVRLPAGIAVGATEIATSRATSQAVPAVSDTAVDSIHIVHARTYANTVRTVHSASFYRCGTVYVGGGGLAPGSDYRFVWSDPNLADGDERVSPAFSADDSGRVDDRYVIPLSKATGTWTVRVQIKQGSSWIDVTPLGSFNFTVADGAGTTGRIDSLGVDRLNYALSGDTLRVRASVYNPSSIYFWRDTLFNFVVFRDANGNDQPDAGETYIRSDGTSAAWSAGLTTRTRSAITVYPYGRAFDAWRVNNVQFPTSAVWSVYMSWDSACSSPIDRRISDFSVGCAIQPTADAGQDRSLCAGAGAVIGTPAEAKRSYSWSPPLGLNNAGIAQPVAAPAATTSYTVTVTDIETLCTASDSVQVTVLALPAPNVTPDGPELCEGGSVILDAGPGYAGYLWSNGATSSSILVAPLATTTYAVTVTGANGCQGDAFETVIVDPLPVPDVKPDAPQLCAGQSVTLDGGVGFAAYQWSSGQATRTITVTPAASASYGVTVTDGSGCQGSASESVTVHALPVPDVKPDGPAVCVGQPVTLDGGAGFAAYQWSSGETSRTITVTPAASASYGVTATDGFGCQGSASETVTVHALPVPDVKPDAPGVCAGQPVTLDGGAGFAAYQWSSGETSRTITVTPAASASYGVTATDGFGCQGSASETVTVHALPVPDVKPDGPAVCVGQPVTLDGGAGFAAYQWSSGETSRTITVTPAASASYGVTATDGFGCQGSASETVTVHPLPSPPVVPDRSICAGDSTLLDAGGSGWVSYLWSTGETTPGILVTPGVTTTYSVTATDIHGCGATRAVTVTVNAKPLPLVSPSAPRLCPGGSVWLDAGAGHAGYQWSTGETTQSIQVSPTATTLFTVTVTGAGGCTGSTSVSVVVSAPPPADAGPDAASCPGIGVRLGSPSASPGLVYAWLPGGGLDDPATARPLATVSETTTYSLTVTDPATGCSAGDTVTVDVPAPADTPLGNLLRLTRAGADLIHHWTDVLGLLGYEIAWSPDKASSPAIPVGTIGAGIERRVETDAVSGDLLPRFYQVIGRDCPPTLTP